MCITGKMAVNEPRKKKKKKRANQEGCMSDIVFKYYLVVGNEKSLNHGVRSAASHRVRTIREWHGGWIERL